MASYLGMTPILFFSGTLRARSTQLPGNRMEKIIVTSMKETSVCSWGRCTEAYHSPHHLQPRCIFKIGSISTCVFETRTTTGSELFSLLTCFHTTTFTLLSIFSPLEMINIKIWGHRCPGRRNFLFRLPSLSQKRACLSSLI